MTIVSFFHGNHLQCDVLFHTIYLLINRYSNIAFHFVDMYNKYT